MSKDNKIIAFQPVRRKKSSYILEAEISVYLCRTDIKYHTDWSSKEEYISKAKIYFILKEIYDYLYKKYGDIDNISLEKGFEIIITFLYYNNPSGKIKYIYLPQNIPEKEIMKYLFITLLMYESENGILN